jgi:hypothetical protein
MVNAKKNISLMPVFCLVLLFKISTGREFAGGEKNSGFT